VTEAPATAAPTEAPVVEPAGTLTIWADAVSSLRRTGGTGDPIPERSFVTERP
jgi:hypothetical protein